MASDWSADWKRSTQPAKQRKYRENAAYHHRQKFLNARLDDGLRERVGTKTLPIRTGDRVQVERGDHAGETGEVRSIDTDDYTVEVDGVERETVGGSETRIALDPSNLTLIKLDLDDERRIAKYDVSEEEKEKISVEATEADEAAEDVEEEPGEADEEDVDETDYEALVQENISDIKDRVEDDLDPEKVLEAEQDNKDRTTLVDWLEDRIDSEDTVSDDTDQDDTDYEALVQENIADIKDRVQDEELDPEKVLEAEQDNKDRTTLVEWLERRVDDE